MGGGKGGYDHSSPWIESQGHIDIFVLFLRFYCVTFYRSFKVNIKVRAKDNQHHGQGQG